MKRKKFKISGYKEYRFKQDLINFMHLFENVENGSVRSDAIKDFVNNNLHLFKFLKKKFYVVDLQ